MKHTSLLIKATSLLSGIVLIILLIKMRSGASTSPGWWDVTVWAALAASYTFWQWKFVEASLAAISYMRTART